MLDTEKKTILVVDDVEINRGILSSILSEKYRVIEASNGLYAFRALEEAGGRVALILLDIVMPVVDGFGFLKLIQKNPQYTGIPIIFVTSETYQANILEGLKMGVRDVIAKPFDPDALSNRVDNLIALTERRAGRARPRVQPQTQAQPQAPAQAQAPEHVHHSQMQAAPPVPPAPARRAVLIVDDVEVNRAILQTALEASYDTIEAGNGQEALALLEKHNREIAVVLLDMVMPVMDGYEMMQEARQRNLLDNIPVIAITADGSLSKRGRMMGMGVHEIIEKPFVPDVVQARVDHLVELYGE